MRGARIAIAPVGVLVAVLVGCGSDETSSEPPLVLVAADPSDAPLAGLSARELARFAAGDARFEHPFRETQGLGPLYIHRSCVSCHEGDARGPGAVRRVAQLGVRLGEADNASVLPFGDVLRPRLSAGARTPIALPEGPAVREEVRLGPAVFGRGHLEALPDAAIEGWAAAQAERDDGISGRVHRVPGPDGSLAIGRFGLKARSPTLEEFVADALLGDMGLTSPLRPDELPNPDGLTDDARPGVDVDAEEVSVLADYVRLLAIPRRPLAEPRGAELFEAARCAVCHVPRSQTREDHPVEALRAIEVALYTDVLLHDMGEGLADGVPEHDASGREWRTAPLVGLRHLRALLHDGRASSVREAIALHASEGSEANDSVARFQALTAAERDTLVAFVEAL